MSGDGVDHWYVGVIPGDNCVMVSFTIDTNEGKLRYQLTVEEARDLAADLQKAAGAEVGGGCDVMLSSGRCQRPRGHSGAHMYEDSEVSELLQTKGGVRQWQRQSSGA